MSTVRVGWQQIKDFSNNRNSSIQYVDVNGNYYISSFDGQVGVEMIMSQEDPNNADLIDFVNNYKDSANKSPRSEVVQVLGKDTLSLSPRAIKFDAPANQTSTWDKPIDEILVLRGGLLFSNNANIGDSLTVSIVDKDNVLGFGGTPSSPTVVGQYVKEWYVMPGIVNELADVSISQPLQSGLYVRFEYTNTSQTSTVNVIVNLISYEFI